MLLKTGSTTGGKVNLTWKGSNLDSKEVSSDILEQMKIVRRRMPEEIEDEHLKAIYMARSLNSGKPKQMLMAERAIQRRKEIETERG